MTNAKKATWKRDNFGDYHNADYSGVYIFNAYSGAGTLKWKVCTTFGSNVISPKYGEVPEYRSSRSWLGSGVFEIFATLAEAKKWVAEKYDSLPKL